MMKSLLAALVLALTLVGVGSSGAADLLDRLAYKGPRPPDPRPFNWSGFYFGAHLGGAIAKSDWVDTFPGFVGVNDANTTPSGFLGGGQVGYNYQIDRLVLGIEGDGSWANLSNTVGACFQDTTQSCTTRADWIATVTGRVGYARDRALFYAKGGAAWGHFKYENPCPLCASPNYVATEIRSGWTVGGGIEYALANNWSVKFEYDYLDFGTGTPTMVGTPGDTFTEDITNRVHMVKAGLNYLFVGPH